jgi:dephospho-CoA kinase
MQQVKAKMNTKIIIGVAGMPGAGKSLVTRTAERTGYSIIIMGDVVREETKKRGLPLTPENTGAVMLKLREEEGPAVIAKLCIPKIENTKGDRVIVDGLRSLHELEEYKKHFRKFVSIAICASPETRFQRLFRRKRSDDPQGWTTFHERDMRELSVGLGDLIVLSDYHIVNEGTKIETEKKIYELLREVAENE